MGVGIRSYVRFMLARVIEAIEQYRILKDMALWVRNIMCVCVCV